MVDIHSHFLPCIDDGADSTETSLKMLRDAKNNGADIVAATPHCYLHKAGIDTFLKKRNEAFEVINNIVKNEPEKYPRIFCGAEVYITENLADIENIKNLSYENTDYMLLELNSAFSVRSLAEIIYNLTIIGIKPIIAHLDRFEASEKIVNELYGIDVVYQINASSLEGFFAGGRIKKIVRSCEKVVFSSDMHNMTSRRFNLHTAYKKAGKMFSERRETMFDNGGRGILLKNKFEF